MLKYSLLAMNPADLIIYGAVGLIAIIAFTIGYVRGFTRTGWGAFAWAFAAAGWLLFETKLRTSEEVGIFGLSGWIAGVASFVVCMMLSFLLFGILAGFLRPKKKNYDTIIHQYYQHNEEKFVGSWEETEKYDDEEKEAEDKKRGGKSFKKPFKVKKNKPRFINRLFGGLISLVNCLIVILAIAMVALAILPTYSDALNDIYSVEILEKLKPFIEEHALDLFFSAVIMGMAYGGWRSGFLRGFRAFLLSIGTLVSIGAGFALPFLGVGFAANMSEFFADGIGNFIEEGSFLESFLPVLGQISAGIILSILFAILIALFCKLLQVLARNTRRSGPVRFIDGVFGLVTMIALAIALIAFIIFVLAFFEYFGVNVQLDGWIHENSGFSGEFIKTIKDAIVGVLNDFRGGSLI